MSGRPYIITSPTVLGNLKSLIKNMSKKNKKNLEDLGISLNRFPFKFVVVIRRLRQVLLR